jgi:hypothetical protein
MDSGALEGLCRMMMLKESIASVSLSHPESCTCDTCKAAHGDEAAFARVVDRILALEEARNG